MSIYEVGKVATSVTSLKANELSGNIFSNRVATTGNIFDFATERTHLHAQYTDPTRVLRTRQHQAEGLNHSSRGQHARVCPLLECSPIYFCPVRAIQILLALLAVASAKAGLPAVAFAKAGSFLARLGIFHAESQKEQRVSVLANIFQAWLCPFRLDLYLRLNWTVDY